MRSGRMLRSGAICLLALAACGGGGAVVNPDAGALGNGDAADGSTSIAVDAGGVLPGSIRMALPAYFAPGPEWQRVIAAAPTVGMVMGAGSLLAALVLIFLKVGTSRPVQASDRKAPAMQPRTA